MSFTMTLTTTDAEETDLENTFASFNIEELEVLEVSQGIALPEMGASTGIGTSSSSSSTCSAC